MCNPEEWQRIKAQKAKERAERQRKEEAKQLRLAKKEALRQSLLKQISKIDYDGRVMKPKEVERFRQQLRVKYPPRHYPI